MADQCIICLEELNTAVEINSLPHQVVDEYAPTSPTRDRVDEDEDQSKQNEDPLLIAIIKPCNHVLHDSCLQTWTEKANSCPICRQNFNEVDLYDKVGGTQLSSYAVADKKQVADFDALTWIEDNVEEDDDSNPCPICNEADREETLLICDGCDSNYHTQCIGLPGVPIGLWYCMECVDRGAVNANTNRIPRDAAQQPTALTRQRERRARQARASQWQGAWTQISGRVWQHLNLDIDFPEDGDDRMADFRRHEHSSQFAQRMHIASRQGAPRGVWGQASRQRSRREREQPPVVLPESTEEEAAWIAMDMAQDLERRNQSRKRKSRSATASAAGSPIEPPAEPERKLKRPRTRRVLDTGAASDSAAESNRRQNVPSRRPEQQANSPSFLSSLLKEVEAGTPYDNGQYFDASSAAVPYGDQSSRAASPASSNYSTPRRMSATPPPQPQNNSKRPSSPLSLTSHVMPPFPASNYRPSSDNESDSYAQSSPTSRHAAAASLELRMPRPCSRSHNVVSSPETSPTRSNISLKAKEHINKMVKAALKPYWKPDGITKEQYIEVNKLVSRILYDKAGTEEEENEGWEVLATREVARAVESYGAS